GARLFNAHIQSGQSITAMTAPFHSVSVCFSKGLGAPIGSMLVADAETIHKARRWRKMLGGGMRQAGIVAAALDYALDHHVQRLADDHQCAQQLANALRTAIATQKIQGVTVEPAVTNMVYVQFDQPGIAKQVSEYCRSHGIFVPASARMRLVTHLDVTSAYIDFIVEHFVHAIISDS
ncbi:MAG: beta-eliminating lyase-related protein, partial [Gammaproteobacteria bacterium]|nr:beta-eliminating lyase-related protein [Gammaproteobacteria bacterium]